MTFDNQVKKAKEEKLKMRITRDIVFIVLGIIFLALSFVFSIKNNNNNNENEKNKTTTTINQK